jgi:hypothetical protein
MHKGQLAMLPAAEGRRADRRIVNLAASLREPGAEVVDAEVRNLSTDGFMAECGMALEEGQYLFLKLPGIEALACKVAWVDGGKAGFEFTSPLHQATLDQLTAVHRKAPPRNHFGPRR